MAVTRDSFVARFPEFASRDETLVSSWISSSRVELDSAAWGPLLDRATELLAAHYLSRIPGTSAGSAAAGPVASKSTGGMAVSYAVPASSGAVPSDTDLMTTAYGQMLLRLRRGALFGARTV